MSTSGRDGLLGSPTPTKQDARGRSRFLTDTGCDRHPVKMRACPRTVIAAEKKSGAKKSQTPLTHGTWQRRGRMDPPPPRGPRYAAHAAPRRQEACSEIIETLSACMAGGGGGKHRLHLASTCDTRLCGSLLLFPSAPGARAPVPPPSPPPPPQP
jgi:hypothetical protein